MINVMKLASVLDSVVSQFTIANLVYKIVGHEASAKGWFATGN
ncbi:agmatinase [Nostoc linckia NIES-25]|nr:agmatinase [Nostoc linckia NIES-25]